MSSSAPTRRRFASRRHLTRMRGAVVALTALALLIVAAVAVAEKPKAGHYSGKGSIYNGQAKSKLPVSFTLTGAKISSLSLGPAQVVCSGAGAVTTLTMPKLTGFPAERLATSFSEYTYYFEQLNGAWSSIGSSGTPATGAPYVQVFGAFYDDQQFKSHGGIQIQYNADANGTLDPQGALACSGSWDGTFAKRA